MFNIRAYSAQAEEVGISYYLNLLACENVAKIRFFTRCYNKTVLMKTNSMEQRPS